MGNRSKNFTQEVKNFLVFIALFAKLDVPLYPIINEDKETFEKIFFEPAKICKYLLYLHLSSHFVDLNQDALPLKHESVNKNKFKINAKLLWRRVNRGCQKKQSKL